MDEDELAAKMHSVYISESDSDNSSEDGNSDFDEEYEALRPPSISLENRQQDIIKIAAFKVVCHKNNVLNSMYSKLNTNCKKAVGRAGKSQKDFKFKKRIKSKAKSVGVHSEIVKERKQSSSLISDVPLNTKAKLNESYVQKPLNNKKGVTDYANAVKFNALPLTSKNCDNQVPYVIKIKDCKNNVNRKSNVKHKKNKAGKNKILGSNTSILSMTIENKISVKII